MSQAKLAPFPWQQAMSFGLGTLKLAPRDFWAMTPRELAAAIRSVTGGHEPITRTTFDELLRRFPDDRS